MTLSGNFVSAGEDSRRGIEAALNTSDNRRYLDVQYEDSRNEPSVAITAFRKLLKLDKVAAVYTHRSSIGMALNPASSNSKVPLLGAVGHQQFSADNEFAIQTWPRAHDEGAFLAEEFKRRNLSRVAVLYTEDEWTSSVTEGFRSRLKELGVKLVFDQSVLPGEQDFRTQLLKLKASNPEAIYFNFLLPQIAPAIKQSREIKMPGLLFSNFYLAKKEVSDAVGKAGLEGVSYVELDNNLPKLKEILGKDEPPPGLAVAAYISTLLLAQAARENPQPKNPEELMASLLRQKEIQTSDGVFLIEDRRIKFPLVVKVLQDSQK